MKEMLPEIKECPVCFTHGLHIIMKQDPDDPFLYRCTKYPEHHKLIVIGLPLTPIPSITKRRPPNDMPL